MAKKWTTVRKVDPGEGQGNSDSLSGDNSPSRTPRRRKEARRGTVEFPTEAPTEPVTGDLPSPVPGAYQHPVARSVASHYSEEVVVDTPEPGHGEDKTAAEVEPRILVVHDSASTYRLIEETFGNFTAAKVDSTSDILTAFELSVLRDYQLFIVGFKLPEMSGSIFYELVSRAYKSGLGNRKLAPAIVFVREPEDPLPSEEILTDVRVKAVWSKPLSIERMLESVSSVIKPVEGERSRQPT